MFRTVRRTQFCRRRCTAFLSCSINNNGNNNNNMFTALRALSSDAEAAASDVTLSSYQGIELRIPKDYPGVNKVRMENGHRIYCSRYPSVIEETKQYKGICDYMFQCWQKAPDGVPAFTQAETGEALTYQQMRPVTEKIASVLYHGYGVRKGDVVCLMLHNSIYYPTIAYGIIRLAAITTTINAASNVEGLSTHMEISRAKTIVCSRQTQEVVEGMIVHVKQQTGQEVRALYLEDFIKMEHVEGIPSSYTAMEEAKMDDVAFLPFSSGTTGAPKGVQLTNWNLTVAVVQKSHIFPVSPADRFLAVMPFFHIFGFTSIMSGGMAGNAQQFLATRYHADTYLQYVEKYKITAGFVAPPIVSSLVHRMEQPSCKADVSTLRYLMCSAAPLSQNIAARLRKQMPHVDVGQSWGMTEMAPTVCTYPRDDPAMDYRLCGVLAPDTELRVIKVDDSQQSGADKSAGIDVEEEGQEGEIWVRGPQRMKGYLNPEDDYNAVMEDGWYRSGDMGYVRPDVKAILISGRLKELIKYKGFQVSPPEIEAELIKHPWVQDCIVVGVTNPEDVSFENARALVVLKDHVKEEDRRQAEKVIFQYIKEVEPPHKQLHGGVHIVDEIPRNATGKLLRRVARQQEMDYIKIHGFPNFK
uniref:4-coumarate--CoA ligase n=1 Tax=Strigomonas galati TaxID=1003336 RepID=T1YSW7_9TRYP|nr:4-coumarate--CoA ligase [Strigomonas galati]